MPSPLYDRAVAGELGDELPQDDVARLMVATPDNPWGDRQAVRQAELWLLDQIKWGRLKPSRTEAQSVALPPLLRVIKWSPESETLQQEVSRKRREAQGKKDHTTTTTVHYFNEEAGAAILAALEDSERGKQWPAKGLKAWSAHAVERARQVQEHQAADEARKWMTQRELTGHLCNIHGDEIGADLMTKIIGPLIKHLPAGEIEGLRKKVSRSRKDYVYLFDELINRARIVHPQADFASDEGLAWYLKGLTSAKTAKRVPKKGQTAGMRKRIKADATERKSKFPDNWVTRKA